VIPTSVASIKPHRSDKENRRFEISSALSTISSPRNTARARRVAHFESASTRMTATGSRITDSVPFNAHNAWERHSLRRGILVTTLASTAGEEMAPKRRKSQSRANFVRKHEHCLRARKGLRWKGTVNSLKRRFLYQKRRTTSAPAPAARTSPVIDAGREGSEFKWLGLNQQQYAGRWVALDGSSLLAVGNSAREVYSAIAGHKGTPLVTYVEKENEPYFAGW
jgi:hypothetical protein